ncbi:hypothetical protein N7495_001047 [Penicillium taxi]|uniref:uncharacterized protein n=1 Tax=Penicillium taxi TaxID=168475 RepID=UPI0025456C73|nr:uncharacterized protein N7495_001047 [Penicillium taxi]KAJ5908365.1 hypothetical protein N7495_001047 [Penicillium taxi]
MTTSSLPPDFIWGFSTANYQIEGALDVDGRGASIWDAFCETPGKIADGTTAATACNAYHRTQEDIALLKELKTPSYRFSFSWPRIIPLGGRNDPINEKGLNYYVKLIDDLIAAGITPMVTIYHWDLPAALHDRYGGLLNKEEFTADFSHYVRLLFKTFGDKVKHWITFNEPFCIAVLGYNTATFAPGHSSATEHWIVGHNILVAHGAAVKIYREEFKPQQKGSIGITLNGDWVEPWDPEDPEDLEAQTRRLEFAIGWFADPIYKGKYPDSMIKQLGDRLPTWEPEDIALVKGSNDFYGMNHYCSTYVKHKTTPPEYHDFMGNLEVPQVNKAGESIGPETASHWLRPNPPGFRKLLKWLSDRYDYPTIYVTENGTTMKGETEMPLEQILNDEFRVKFYKEYIENMADAYTIDGVNVVAYFGWSLMDNFEWADGFEPRFGCVYVDYEDNQKRTPKKSARVMHEVFDRLIKKE